MKKMLSLLLALGMLLALCACGAASTDDLAGLWSGSWESEGKQISKTIVFETNGSYLKGSYENEELSSIERGTYAVKGGKVYLYENGEKGSYTKYKYGSDGLENNGHLITKATASSDGLPGLWQGSWSFEGANYNKTIVFGENGEYMEAVYKNGEFADSEKGTYEIEGSKLYLYENGSKGAFTKYDYDGQSLQNNGHSITKVK